MSNPVAPNIRVFISSTFHDFQAERNILVKRIFPDMRSQLRESGLDLVEIDLRWGITAEQSERGETLPICLAEVDRCRPYFIGLLGDRYGWSPPQQAIASLALAYPEFSDAFGSSATELEILHGALNAAPSPQQRALFYFRAPGPDTDEPPDCARKLAALKHRIRESGLPLVEGYANAETFGERVRADLFNLIKRDFPDIGDRQDRRRSEALHLAFAQERARLFAGREDERAKLAAWRTEALAKPMLLSGIAGTGKTALLAAWCAQRAAAGDCTFEHYVGAGPDSDRPADILQRLADAVRQRSGVTINTEGPLAAGFAACFEAASRHAQSHGVEWIIALDGLDQLTEGADLLWMPAIMPARVRVLATSLDDGTNYKDLAVDRIVAGLTRTEAAASGEHDYEPFSLAHSQFAATHAWRSRRWSEIEVADLNAIDRRNTLTEAVGRYHKSLSPHQIEKLVSHPFSGSPLFLSTLVDELRMFGEYDRLESQIDYYVAATGLPDLFDRVLARLERDCAPGLSANAFELLWCSRAGLEETELMRLLAASPLQWSTFLIQAGDIVRVTGGRVVIANPTVKAACKARYLTSELKEQSIRRVLAAQFDDDRQRAAEERPWQLREAKAWNELEALLTDADWLPALMERGQAELLSHWIPLKAQGRDIESSLISAWRSRSVRRGAPGDTDMGAQLAAFLRFAGAIGETTLKLHHEVVEAYRRGGRHSESVTMGFSLARLLLARGEYRQAEKQIKETSRRRRTDEAEGRADAATAQTILGRIRLARREYASADALFRSAIPILREIRGDAHPETLSVMLDLAWSAAGRGDLAEAAKIRREILEQRKRTLGEEHPDTLDARTAFLNTRLDQGDLSGAKFEARAILEANERLHGLDHPQTLQSAVNLALVLQTLDDHYARGLLTFSCRELDRVLGDQPNTLSALHSLGCRLLMRRHYPEAEAILRRVLDARTSLLGADHPDTLDTCERLAKTLFEQGRLDEAEPLQNQVARMWTKNFGRDHPMARYAQDGRQEITRARHNPKVIREHLDLPLKWAPAIGVVFDIDELNDMFYGRAAYQILFDALPPMLLANTRWRDGDAQTSDGGGRRLCIISIETADPQQTNAIRTAIEMITHPGMLSGPRRFLSGAELERQPLVVAMRLNARGVPDYSAGDAFPLEAWNAARAKRDNDAGGDAQH